MLAECACTNIKPVDPNLIMIIYTRNTGTPGTHDWQQLDSSGSIGDNVDGLLLLAFIALLLGGKNMGVCLCVMWLSVYV